MELTQTAQAVLALGMLTGGAWAGRAAWQRLQLSRAKHRSLAGHARWAKRIAGWIPRLAYGAEQALACDDAPADVPARRRAAGQRLAADFAAACPQGLALTAAAKPAISDLQFTAAYRVPFPFADWVQQALPSSTMVSRSKGVMLEDVDGNEWFDLTGAYGVNLFGQDFYKRCIDEGAARVRALGPVLGWLHPIAAANARRLCEISGLDEVSFHMSGTEAVMQAVRLARYHTGRSHVVRFAGAYHGWWDDVQPGPGNPLPAERTYTLADMSERTLQVLRSRRDIACVLVNPLQALHPNRPAPGDSALVAGGRSADAGSAHRQAYGQWLQRLQQVCQQQGIVFILDEVFLGFRLAPGGAQQYFGVQADLVTYGKTLGGGLPVGVLCGRAALMRRFRPERPADPCFARGTFNSHPYVMGAMQVFLEQIEAPEIQALYEDLDTTWDQRAAALNARLEGAGLPVRVANLSSVWTVLYTQPSRYHWMLQYYLREQRLALAWVGSGRLIFSLNYSAADFEAVAERFVAAAQAMQADGWWWHDGVRSNRDLQRSFLRELLAARWRPAAANPRPAAEAPLGAPVPAAEQGLAAAMLNGPNAGHWAVPESFPDRTVHRAAGAAVPSSTA